MISLSTALSFILDVYNRTTGEEKCCLRNMIYRSFDVLVLVLSPNFNVGANDKSKLLKYDVDLHILRIIHRLLSDEEPCLLSSVIKSINRDAISSLLQLISGESGPAFLRVLAAALLETLLSKKVISAIIHEPFSPSLRSSIPKLSALDMILRTASFPHPQDMSKGNGVISCCLRIIVASVPYCSEWVLKQNWKFLVRIMHDRRANLRILSIILLADIFRLFRSHGKWSKADSGSSVEPVEGLADSLMHVAADNFECSMVRVLATRILIKERLMPNQSVHKVLSCCTSIINEPLKLLSLKSITQALDIIFDCCDTYPEETFSLVRTFNIFPKIVSLLKPESFEDSLNAIAMRAHVVALKEQEGTKFHYSSWMKAWEVFEQTFSWHFVCAISSTTRLTHKLCASSGISQNPGFILPSVASNIAANLARPRKLHYIPKSDAILFAYRSQADFICSIIFSNPFKNPDESPINGFFSERIVYTAQRLLKEICENIKSLKKISSNYIQSLTSILRLLSFCLESEDCRANMSLGDPLNKSSWSSEANNLFNTLTECRYLLQSLNTEKSHRRCSLMYQMDIVIALFLKYSQCAKVALVASEMNSSVLKGLLLEIRQHLLGRNVKDSELGPLRLLKAKSTAKARISSSRQIECPSPIAVNEFPAENKW